jgi:F-type H+-transporting ATPase subunit b
MMPQFDVTTFPSQIFWLMICVAILCFAMAQFLVPRIGLAISTRQQTLNQCQESADRINNEAHLLMEKNHRHLESARVEMNHKMHHYLTDLNQTRDDHVAEYERTTQKQLQDVNATLSQQRGEILTKDADQLVFQLSGEAFTHITGQSIDESLLKESVLSVKT